MGVLSNLHGLSTRILCLLQIRFLNLGEVGGGQALGRELSLSKPESHTEDKPLAGIVLLDKTHSWNE